MAVIRFLTIAGIAAAVHAAPAANAAIAPITNAAQLSSALTSLAQYNTSSQAQNFINGYLDILSAIQPAASPANFQQAASAAAAAHSAYPSNPLGAAASILLSGLSDNPIGSPAVLNGFGACNGNNFTNPIPPSQVIYPKKSASDAPYDNSEKDLRGAIYIPPSFKYGKVPPVVFVPGTGVEACENFNNSLGKLFTGSSIADPIYVNIPANSLADAQLSSEYTAYAINYISSISRSNVSVITWSQGGISTQWALKYWPSTRSAVTDFIAISPDFHGTVETEILCPEVPPTGPSFPCPPSVLQQAYTAEYIQTLRNNGGDTAYVPTTEIHSIFDEIVEPQDQDSITGASASISNGLAQATNVQVQDVCPPLTPAGGPNFGHENSIYSAVTYAIIVDALTHPGPADIARSGASSQCGNFAAPGLTLADVLATEALIPLAGYNIFEYRPKVTQEPPIKAYAAADKPILGL